MAEGGDQRHPPEERLERLLGRLAGDSHSSLTAVAQKSHHLDALHRGEALLAREAASLPGQPQRYVEGVQPDEYQDALPLLRRAVAAVGGGPEDDSSILAAKIVGALRERHGFTPDLLADISPYLAQFVHDVHAGIVQLDTEDRAAAGEFASADGTGPDVAYGPPSAGEGGGATEATAETAPSAADEGITPDAPMREEARDIVRPAKARMRTRRGRSGDAETRAEATPGSPGMRVIAVCSQKGGAGKTTIAAHLAVRAGETGHGPAVLIDTDPQGSLGEWWRARHADSPALAKVKLEDLAANLAELRSYGTALAIIDTPPALTGSIEQVIAVADLVVIPARPSPHDLRAVGATVEMARRAGKPFLFVVNGAAPRASITAQAVAALSEHGRVVPVILYQRTDFAASMIDGRTVTETAAAGNSAQEIGRLWDYVYEQISMRVAA